MSLLKMAVTGGIGCGKSEAGRMLREHGIPVLDTDDLAKEVLEPGHPVYRSVVQAFGSSIVEPESGGIRRDVLADLVFSESESREKLNRLMHPEIRQRVRAWMDENHDREMVVVLVPLLFEAGFEKEFDHVLCVAADEDRVLERLARKGLSGDQARGRIRAQMPLQEKMSRADTVLINNGSLENLRISIDEMLEQLMRKEQESNG